MRTTVMVSISETELSDNVCDAYKFANSNMTSHQKQNQRECGTVNLFVYVLRRLAHCLEVSCQFSEWGGF